MQPDKPLISIITINYRQPEATLEFLESIRSLLYDNFEIILCEVVPEGDYKSRFEGTTLPRLLILDISQNLGFGGANNFAANAAQGEFLLFINNDTIVTPGLLDALIEPLLADPTIGISSPKIRNYYNRQEIEYAGFQPMNMLTARTSSIGFGETDVGQYNASRVTAGAHGCAMLISRNLFHKLEGFYEPYFLYYEDWDLSMRVQQLGYKIWYESTALVYHKGSLTTGSDSIQKTYYQTRNRILLIKRNANVFQRRIFSVFFVLFAIPKSLLKYIATFRFQHIIPFLKAVNWNVRNSKKTELRSN